MSNADQYQPHYTVEDYELWEGDWELWDGHAIAMSPAARPDHQRIVDPDERTIELLTLNDTGEYQSTPATDAKLSLTSGCEISLDLTRVFG